MHPSEGGHHSVVPAMNAEDVYPFPPDEEARSAARIVSVVVGLTILATAVAIGPIVEPQGPPSAAETGQSDVWAGPAHGF